VETFSTANILQSPEASNPYAAYICEKPANTASLIALVSVFFYSFHPPVIYKSLFNINGVAEINTG